MLEEGREGGGAQICPLLTNVTSQSYIIVKSRSNLASLLIVGGGGGCVLDVLMDFRQSKVEKPWKSLFDHNLLVFSAKELTGSNVKNVYPYDFVTEELLHGWTGRFL